jgi:hypothetical protein
MQVLDCCSAKLNKIRFVNRKIVVSIYDLRSLFKRISFDSCIDMDSQAVLPQLSGVPCLTLGGHKKPPVGRESWRWD